MWVCVNRNASLREKLDGASGRKALDRECVRVRVSAEAREKESKKGSSAAADGREERAEAEACRGSKLH